MYIGYIGDGGNFVGYRDGFFSSFNLSRLPKAGEEVLEGGSADPRHVRHGDVGDFVRHSSFFSFGRISSLHMSVSDHHNRGFDHPLHLTPRSVPASRLLPPDFFNLKSVTDYVC